MFLTIAANVLAFSIGTVFLERYDPVAGVATFLVTALAGTILSTMVEAYLQSVLPSLGLARAKRPRPVFREAPKPLPSSSGLS